MSANTRNKVESDGSITEPPAADRVTVAETGAGVLVFETETERRDHLDREVVVAKQLVGFAGVDDWSVIRDALRNRGLGVGAVTTLPTFDLDEIPGGSTDTTDEDGGRPEPSRSEPADFGGGETTGVQDL